MIIVKIIGGLGNQMLQYAFYKALINSGIEAKIDISGFKNYKAHNGYELERVFGVKPNYATLDECYKLGMPKTDIFNRVKRRLYRELGIFNFSSTYYEQSPEESVQYLPQIFNGKDNMYLFGFWTSYKYFENIYNEILAEFTFARKLDMKNQKIKEEMESCNSVSLHVRRGDFLKLDLFHNICTIDYYRKSIKYIMDRREDLRFYVFSNDIDWCKEHLLIENVKYIEHNKGNNSYKDMQLMSFCKHNIIANSTFSLWGGHLNSNKEKIVCCPSRFLNLPVEQHDITPFDWIEID